MSLNKDGGISNIQSLYCQGCIEAAEKIISYISQFDIESVACAVFCINSWHENRSCQTNVYALNAALLAHMTQSTVKGHNGPADRLQSVGGACR